jgi:hypothetical protein
MFTIYDEAKELVRNEAGEVLHASCVEFREFLRAGGVPSRRLVAYQELRRAAYPSIAEQLDMMFRDGASWRASIQHVKDTIPKQDLVMPMPAWVETYKNMPDVAPKAL